MAEHDAPDQPWTMTFPWKPGEPDTAEPDQEPPARTYPRQNRQYDPLEPPADTDIQES